MGFKSNTRLETYKVGIFGASLVHAMNRIFLHTSHEEIMGHQKKTYH